MKLEDTGILLTGMITSLLFNETLPSDLNHIYIYVYTRVYIYIDIYINC